MFLLFAPRQHSDPQKQQPKTRQMLVRTGFVVVLVAGIVVGFVVKFGIPCLAIVVVVEIVEVARESEEGTRIDDSYMPIRSNYCLEYPLPDVRVAYAIISSEESHRVVSTSNVGTSQRSQSSVFNSFVNNRGATQRTPNSGNFSRPNNVTRPSGGGNRRINGGPQLVCENCGFNGHTIDRCLSDNCSSSTFSDDQLSKIISLIKDNSLNNGKGVQANMAAGVIVDSGANQHLTYTDKFCVMCNISSSWNNSFTIPMGLEAVITSVGDMDLRKIKFWDCNQIDVYITLIIGDVHRDVKFFEKVFPFKIRQTQDTNLTSQGLDHVNFFNEIVHEDLDTSNDEPSKTVSSQSDGSHPSTPGISTIDPFENELGHSQGSNGFAGTGEEAATSAENNISSEDAFVASESIPESVPTTSSPHVRRSERTSVFPRKYNDFVIDSKVKYGLENYVSYVNLSVENKCFTTELNKSLEPRSFFEASKDQHWIEAMNNEMDALYRNDTWEIVELPFGRKAIGGKWVYKIKYKSSWLILTCIRQIIAKGYNKKEGLDFMNFSPTCGENLSLLDLGKLKYFLGIEVIDTDRGLCLSQRKYCLDLLSDFGLLACKPSATPLEQNLTITNEPSSTDPVLDNFMHKPLKSHLKIALKVLRYLKNNPGIGVHIVKQPKVSLEAFVCMRLRQIAAIKIAANPVFHERTKHLEIDLHFVREKILSGVCENSKKFFSSADQNTDISTERLDRAS
ncbi:ribonuclease H-like domain-containing protein [Tanacetum coccineum]|uniref:Ribonuclease H-like domain-containing protein n=1 Tax=Tanacetum coccineum TaxID=301880 RepID=A0ABQ5H9T2_9ASTR